MNDFDPVIVAFCCHYCAYAAADLAGSARLEYPPNIKIIKIPCSGRIDIIHILRAFESGVDGVYIGGCREGTCHFMSGNFRAKKRVQYVKKLLGKLSIEKERVEMYNMSASEGYRFCEVAKEMTETIKSLGPSPLRRDKS